MTLRVLGCRRDLGPLGSESLRIKVEFTVEPFVEGGPGPHVRAALDQVRARGLAVDIGPFANTLDGEHHQLLKAIEPLVTAALANGASAVTVGVSRFKEPSPRAAAFLDALAPVLAATGATLVEPDEIHAADAPIHWEGELVGGVRLPLVPVTVNKTSDALGPDRLTDLILQVEHELGGELHTLSRTKKQAAARLLEERGAFRCTTTSISFAVPEAISLRTH
jgi:uncharacterized protein YqgV (UPF0045/DUF77 family)